MFTGIVTHIGTIARIDKTGGDWKIFVETALASGDLALGNSIACSGCCLTVIDMDHNWFACSVSGETLSKTIIGSWALGTRINLERSMRLGDELGGHLLSGHVDGVATLKSVRQEGDSHRLEIAVPNEFAPFIAPKGSVAIDGISLTVNEVSGNIFGVNIIPYTWINTTLGEKKPGSELNLEVDLLARYVARQLGKA